MIAPLGSAKTSHGRKNAVVSSETWIGSRVRRTARRESRSCRSHRRDSMTPWTSKGARRPDPAPPGHSGANGQRDSASSRLAG
jgi:hypothetical protein